MKGKRLLIWISLIVLITMGIFLIVRYTEPNATKTNQPNDSSGQTTYTKLLDWPPQVQVVDEMFSCTEAGASGERAGRTDRRTIDGREYCVTEIIEGAAGSIYTQFAYAFEKSGKTVILTFSIRHPQCGNYPDTERLACEQEVASFNADNLVGEIADEVIVPTATTPFTPTNPSQNFLHPVLSF